MAISPREPISIAIVGAGIVGLSLAVGLSQRGIKVHLYEQAANFKEIGAGVAFGPNAVRAMTAISPDVAEAFRSVASSNGDAELSDSWFEFVDGHTHAEASDAPHAVEPFLFDLTAGGESDGCHRAHFLDGVARLAAPTLASFGKHLDNITYDASGRPELHFSDGTTAAHDAVIGADGIKSRVRGLLLGDAHPAAHPVYSHKFAFRGLIPMDRAVEALGARKARNRHMHVGPDAHILTFPVAKGSLMNVVAFVTDEGEWPDAKRLTLPAHKEEAQARFAGWGPAPRAIMDLLLDDLDKWGIFDLHDAQLDRYAYGRVVLAGDAAHATSPHQGAGAGCGLEDAMVLCGLLARVDEMVRAGKADRGAALTAAFKAYDGVRVERANWLVRSSRRMGDTYEWRNPEAGRDPKKMHEVIRASVNKIWLVDEKKMVADAIGALNTAVGVEA